LYDVKKEMHLRRTTHNFKGREARQDKMRNGKNSLDELQSLQINPCS
jgi:hypothetical protein